MKKWFTIEWFSEKESGTCHYQKRFDNEAAADNLINELSKLDYVEEIWKVTNEKIK